MHQKRPFPKDVLSCTIDMPFEDRTYSGMSDYDSYLRNGYGDYMKLPPKEKQVSHHMFNAWWKE